MTLTGLVDGEAVKVMYLGFGKAFVPWHTPKQTRVIKETKVYRVGICLCSKSALKKTVVAC